MSGAQEPSSSSGSKPTKQRHRHRPPKVNKNTNITASDSSFVVNNLQGMYNIPINVEPARTRISANDYIDRYGRHFPNAQVGGRGGGHASLLGRGAPNFNFNPHASEFVPIAYNPMTSERRLPSLVDQALAPMLQTIEQYHGPSADAIAGSSRQTTTSVDESTDNAAVATVEKTAPVPESVNRYSNLRGGWSSVPYHLHRSQSV